MQQLRDRDDLLKPPGVAETLDWARALHHLGTAELDLESAAATLGALVKYREDTDRVRHALDRMLRHDDRASTPTRARRGPARLHPRAAGGRACRSPRTARQAFLARGRAARRRRPSRHLPVAGRATLCAGPDDLDRYDQVFEAFFNARDGLPRPRPRTPATPASPTCPTTERRGEGGDDAARRVRAAASEAEVLRHRDVAALTAAEKHRLAGDVRHPATRDRRAAYGPAPAVAPRPRRRRRTLRASLRRMGEPARIAWRRRGVRPRRVVLLIDVSGSMSGYADALLRLAHRLTHAARAGRRRRDLHRRHPAHPRHPRAAAARPRPGARRRRARPCPTGRAAPGSARRCRCSSPLGPARDGARRGRGGLQRRLGARRPALLGEQMARLRRIAHRVVWVNPHRGKAGYEPVQQGVVAALPHVDDFVAGHSLATFAELMEVVARA